MVDPVQTSTEAASSPGCPMCREHLKPDARACVWCGYLLDESMRREQAACRRRLALGRGSAEPEAITVGDRIAYQLLAVFVPAGLVLGEGGGVTLLFVVLLLILAGLGFIALLRAQVRRFLGYLVAGLVGIGLFWIVLVAYAHLRMG